MPRKPRLDLPGMLYHVIVRGVERRSIFQDDDDRSDFVTRLAAGLRNTQSQCLTWALMTNHFHLLIRAGVCGISALMHPLLTGYVGRFNRRHRRVGHLVQNRFKAILCQEERYFRELIRYIPLNPVRAGLIRTPEALARYPWTGHSSLLGFAPRSWQATQEVLLRFDPDVSTAQSRYQTHVLSTWNAGFRNDLENGFPAERAGSVDAEVPLNNLFDSRILGSSDFVKQIMESFKQGQHLRRAVRDSGIDQDTLRSLAAQVYAVDPSAILRDDRRRPAAKARALFVYAATEWMLRPSAEIATLLRMSSGSISEARHRGERLAEKIGFQQMLQRQCPTLGLPNRFS